MKKSASVMHHIAIANELFTCGVPDKALKAAEEALNLLLVDDEIDPYAHCEVGKMFTLLGKKDICLQLAGDAEEFAREIAFDVDKADALGLIAEVYAVAGERTRACSVLVDALAAGDSIYSVLAFSRLDQASFIDFADKRFAELAH